MSDRLFCDIISGILSDYTITHALYWSLIVRRGHVVGPCVCGARGSPIYTITLVFTLVNNGHWTRDQRALNSLVADVVASPRDKLLSYLSMSPARIANCPVHLFVCSDLHIWCLVFIFGHVAMTGCSIYNIRRAIYSDFDFNVNHFTRLNKTVHSVHTHAEHSTHFLVLQKITTNISATLILF